MYLFMTFCNSATATLLYQYFGETALLLLPSPLLGVPWLTTTVTWWMLCVYFGDSSSGSASVSSSSSLFIVMMMMMMIIIRLFSSPLTTETLVAAVVLVIFLLPVKLVRENYPSVFIHHHRKLFVIVQRDLAIISNFSDYLFLPFFKWFNT